MAKTTTRQFTETGQDGEPVQMIEIIDADPAPSLTEIREAIAMHELALVTAIRDAKATYGDGRISMLIQTIKLLKELEAGK